MKQIWQTNIMLKHRISVQLNIYKGLESPLICSVSSSGPQGFRMCSVMAQCCH